MPTSVWSVGAADRARLRGVVPGELGLGWGTGGGKRCGLGGEAEAGEQAAGEVGIGDEGHDGTATTAGALKNVLAGRDGVDRHAAICGGPARCAATARRSGPCERVEDLDAP